MTVRQYETRGIHLYAYDEVSASFVRVYTNFFLRGTQLVRAYENILKDRENVH